jgi:hypothetical protein
MGRQRENMYEQSEHGYTLQKGRSESFVGVQHR